MVIEFDKSFEKSIDKINNKIVFRRINNIIIEFEKSKSLKDISNVKKLIGYRNYYRIRI